MTRRPEVFAAVVNGAVVLVLPWMVVALDSLFGNHATVTVHPAGWSPWPAAIRDFIVTAPLMVPLALLAAWRTWAHAKRWQGGDRGWQGVAEAGGVGLALALLVLLPSIVRNLVRPVFAATYATIYVGFYGGLALVVGLAVGLLLQTTAVVVLELSRRISHTPNGHEA